MITSINGGAYIRNGLDLSSTYIGMIPYGTMISIKYKVINAMGLSRYYINPIYVAIPYYYKNYNKYKLSLSLLSSQQQQQIDDDDTTTTTYSRPPLTAPTATNSKIISDDEEDSDNDDKNKKY